MLINILQTGQYFRNFRNQCRLSSVTLFGGYILLYLKCSVLVGKISCHGKRQACFSTTIDNFYHTAKHAQKLLLTVLLCTCFFKDNHNHCHCFEIVIITIKQLHRFMIFSLGKVATDLIALIIHADLFYCFFVCNSLSFYPRCYTIVFVNSVMSIKIRSVLYYMMISAVCCMVCSFSTDVCDNSNIYLIVSIISNNVCNNEHVLF